MKLFFKTLLVAAMCTVCSGAFAEAYTLISRPGTASTKVALQGGGSKVINDKSLSKLLHLSPDQSSAIHITINLNPDHTMSGSVDTDALFYLPSQILFNISGIWYRPTNSKVIYIAPDGNPIMGEDADGAYGQLFNPTLAPFLPVQNLIPMMFGKKVSGFDPIYSSIRLTTGIIKLTLDQNGEITSATSAIRLSGRALTSYCKLDSFKQCTIPKGTKDANFNFGMKAKYTVTTL
ncbi:MAG TPA: hypothetical protein VLB90_09275 [Pseudomonadales bacterium]|nr:hypothetical protein [Pseudomonadales bacterium]